MKVETFEVEEVNNDAAAMAADSEAQELIQSLGLNGQKSLLNTGTTTRNPYRRMTKEEEFVYSILCPSKTSVEEYSDALIPIRVLQVFAHAKDTGFFKRFEIWAAESASVKDPVLVGYATNPTRSWGEVMFILARWGAELIPVDEMMPAAFQGWKNKRKAKLLDIREKLEAAIRSLEATASIPRVTSLEEPYLNLPE